MGLIDGGKRLIAAVVETVESRLHLLGVELREYLAMAGAILVLACVGSLLAGLAFCLLAVVVVVIFWEDRDVLLWALAVLFLLYALLAAACFAVARHLIRRMGVVFEATMAELREDRVRLKVMPS